MRRTCCIIAIMMSLLACRREQPLEWSSTPFLDIDSPWVDSVLNSMTTVQKIGQLLYLDLQADQLHSDSIEGLALAAPLGGFQLQGYSADSFLQLTHQLNLQQEVPLLLGTDRQFLLNNQFSAAQVVPSDDVFQQLQPQDSLRLIGEQVAAQQRQVLGINCQFIPWQYLPKEQPIPLSADRLRIVADLPTNSIRVGPDTIYWDSSVFKRLEQLQAQGMAGYYIDEKLISQQRSPGELATLFRDHLNFDGLLITAAGPRTALSLLAGSADMLLIRQDPRPVLHTLLKAYRSGKLREADLNYRVARILMAKAWLREKALAEEQEQKERAEQVQYDQAGLLSAAITAGDMDADSSELSLTLNEHFAAGIWRLFNHELYESSSVVVHNREQLLPFRQLLHSGYHLIHLDAANRQTLESVFGYYADYSKYYHLRDKTGHYPSLKLSIPKREVCVVTMTQALDAERDSLFLSELYTLAENTKVVVAYFGPLYGLEVLDDRFSIIYFPQYNELTQQMAAQTMFGGFSPRGKLNESVNAYFPAGTGSKVPLIRLRYTIPEAVGIAPQKLVSIDAIVESAIDDGAFPGCQVLVAKNGSVIYSKAFGHHDYNRSRAVSKDDLYDLASITKVAATTLAAMKLYEEEKFRPAARIRDYLPCPSNSRIKNIPIEKLLIHQSGLQPHLPVIPYLLFRDTVNIGCDSFYCDRRSSKYPVQVADNFYFQKSYYERIWQDLHYINVGKRRRYRYSDANFVLVQRILEAAGGMPLDEVVQEHFYSPLGLRHITYRPMDRFERSRIVPTQQDGRWRQQLVHGYVHDETAALMGGVAGHAGLFANAEDLSVIFQMLLNGGEYGGTRYLQPETVELFTSARHGNHRGFGFDTAHPDSRSAFAASASKRTFGHTGFTGTCVWADPDHELLFIFLSNRINPNIKNRKLFKNKVRERIHQVVYDALDSYQPDWIQQQIAIE